MVTRTLVLPPVAGQVAGVMTIWAFVMVGLSEVAAFCTAVRAAMGSFCSAIARTPSRAAAERVPCTWKAWPNSAMPSTRRTSSGTINANSTALAPRSPGRRRVIRATSSVCSGAAVPPWGPPRRAAATGRRRSGPAAGQGLKDLVEQVVEAIPEQAHGEDDGDRDQADHQAVLDGGRALLLLLQ